MPSSKKATKSRRTSLLKPRKAWRRAGLFIVLAQICPSPYVPGTAARSRGLTTYAGTRHSFLRHSGAVPHPHQRLVHDGRGDGRRSGSSTSASICPMGHLCDLRARARCDSGPGVRVSGPRFPHSLRRSLQRSLDALVVPHHVSVGRPGRLAPVVVVPAFGLHVLRGPLASWPLHRAPTLGHRHPDEHLDLLRDLDALRGEPVRDLHPNDAGRRRRPQPASSELLDGDSSAGPLHGLRRLVGAVCDSGRRTGHRSARQRVGPRRAPLVDDRLDVPLDRPAARLPLVV